MNKGMWSGVTLLAMLIPGACPAGEIQLGFKFGGGNLEIEADRMSNGDGVKSDGVSAGAALGYRTRAGLMLEFEILGLLNPNSELLSGSVQKSLGIGWQFDRGTWRLTPKAGFLHSYLDAADGRNLLEDGRPSERFTDTVPFIAGTAEYRLSSTFGIGLYLRHVFEDFGSSQAWGVAFNWNID